MKRKIITFYEQIVGITFLDNCFLLAQLIILLGKNECLVCADLKGSVFSPLKVSLRVW